MLLDPRFCRVDAQVLLPQERLHALAHAVLLHRHEAHRRCSVHVFTGEQALRYPFALTIEDPDSESEQFFVTLGMDSLGRVLVGIHTPRGDRIRLISARKASEDERNEYHAQ
ncbi:BrnT family toxin [Desulfonatronum thioautotrophicum]|uniref:BrnT family toxin n=1 Tax=Desulfonatronum thioautotrophicum TaxID=617001 RepID=UPI000A06A908